MAQRGSGLFQHNLKNHFASVTTAINQFLRPSILLCSS